MYDLALIGPWVGICSVIVPFSSHIDLLLSQLHKFHLFLPNVSDDNLTKIVSFVSFLVLQSSR